MGSGVRGCGGAAAKLVPFGRRAESRDNTTFRLTKIASRRLYRRGWANLIWTAWFRTGSEEEKEHGGPTVRGQGEHQPCRRVVK